MPGKSRPKKSGRPGRPRARAGLSRLNSRRLYGRRARPAFHGFVFPEGKTDPEGRRGRRTSRGPSSSWRPSWQPSSSSSPSIWLLATSALTHTTRPLPRALSRRGRTTFRNSFREADSQGIAMHPPCYRSITGSVLSDCFGNCQEKSGNFFGFFSRMVPRAQPSRAANCLENSCSVTSSGLLKKHAIHLRTPRSPA